MEVHCENCPAKYAIPDDKVRGRKVRIKCKHCSSAILVDGIKLGGSPSAAPKSASPRGAAARPASQAPEPAPASQPTAAQAPQPKAAAAAATQPKAPQAAAAPPHAVAAPPQAAGAAQKLVRAALTEAKPAVATAAAPQPKSGPGPAKAGAASSAFDDDEQAPDSAGWWEPAKEAPPPLAPISSSAAWREPAAGGTARGVKATMLGIPAPAVMTSPQPAPLPAPQPAPRPAPLPEPLPAQQVRSIKRTMLGIPAPAELPAQPAQRFPTPVPPPELEPPPDFEETAEPEWTVAVTDEQHEDMTTEQVVQAYVSGRINDETFIWAEGMDDWKNPFEIPLIAAELGARGFSPGDGSTQDDRTVVAPPLSQPKGAVGVWREPGSWREPPLAEGQDEGDVSFDDVTVSMDSRKAAELLRAAGANEAPRPPTQEQLMESDVDDDETLAVDSRPFLAESGMLSDLARHPVNELLPGPHDTADFDEEPTRAIEQTLVSNRLEPPQAQAQAADQRLAFANTLVAGSEAQYGLDAMFPREPPAPNERPPASVAGEQRPTGARNEDSVLFSLDALADSVSQPAKEERADDDILIAPAPPPPELPTFGTNGPQASAHAQYAEQRREAVMAAARPVMAPVVPTGAPAAQRSSRAWLWLLLLLLLAGGAAAAAWHFKQPAKVFELLGIPASVGPHA